MSTVAAKDFVTVVSVDGDGSGGVQTVEDSFVTVLSIGEDAAATDGLTCSVAEEVLVYRLPGERLGFGLRFDGVDTCNRLFVQSCADGSPASRTQASWGPLAAGDEIVQINGRPVNRLSRDDCVRCLKESGLVVKLHMVDGRLAVKAPPPVPPRKQKKPEPPPPIASSTLYTNAVERLFVYHGESESDDTNSSVSTVVSKCLAESSVGEDCAGDDGVLSGGSDKNCVLDRVLEPFMQLEREFSSSAAIGDDVGLYEKLVAVAEEDRLPPKPLPRKEVRPPKKKPPPPPPPLPSSPPPPAYRLPPRLVDFVHKDEPPQTVVDTAAAADDDDVFANSTNTITMPTSDEEITAEQHILKKECDATLERPENLTLSCKPDRLYSGGGDGGGSATMKSSHSVVTEPSCRTDSETDSDGSKNFVTTMTPKRTTSGRTDEVCNRSVRDKIAMFSRATVAGGEKKDSSSSAYSTASADSSPAASPKAVAYSTLPRKLPPPPPQQQQQQQQYSATARPLCDAPGQLQAADHRRSQSLVEQPYSKYFNTMNAYAEMGRSSLNALIEQRRRSMSKLRGLVIPEKVVPGSGSGFGGGSGNGTLSGGNVDESQLHPAAIPDLPLVIKIPPLENDDDDTDAAVFCPPTKTYVNEPTTGTVTRRTNPVLRQSFMVVPALTPASATEQRRPSSASSSPSSSSSSSSTSSSLNSSREELRHIHDERSLSSVKSSNKGSFKADSDEDSALSSSRSSTSLQQYSPASSPPPQSQQPPPLPSSSPPPPPSNNAAVPNHSSSSAYDTGKRVLKAESVEAINRKNVLCSARISSGKPEPQSVLPSSPANSYACKTEYLPNHHHYHQHYHQQQQHSDGPALKSAKSGPVFATGTAIVNRYTHNRMSSVESTTSDDSSMQYAVNAEPFGSISSLASSTSLISQQELQQLIDDANQTLEENNSGCYGIAAAATTHSVEVTVVILHRDIATSSVGITLAGGADYETKEITVYKVLTGSPADKDGRIRKGDRILSINGKSMKGITHRESLAILKAPRSEVVLVISRCKSDTTTESIGPLQSSDIMTSAKNDVIANRVFGPLTKIELSKDGSGLGFSLEGGKNSPTGDQPLTVKKIFTGGCAEQCGQILAGDELVSVNDIDVTGMSRTEAWNLMKRLVNGTVTLCIRHVV
ncbi:putative Polycomb group protein ASXL3 [Rhopalosiphum padi]|uniref:putative Polycomb group protein ASXL3 n=1 Tax=Rhopalosiphum padi TaxID=40932 RepID=UPI00298EA998|nr:putative Polycomb group protein ASXL3 [Rhopalosiphum padi]